MIAEWLTIMVIVGCGGFLLGAFHYHHDDQDPDDWGDDFDRRRDYLWWSPLLQQALVWWHEQWHDDGFPRVLIGWVATGDGALSVRTIVTAFGIPPALLGQTVWPGNRRWPSMDELLVMDLRKAHYGLTMLPGRSVVTGHQDVEDNDDWEDD